MRGARLRCPCKAWHEHTGQPTSRTQPPRAAGGGVPGGLWSTGPACERSPAATGRSSRRVGAPPLEAVGSPP
eukprot:11866654-Alexandrium_andersonii.AAC.1